MNADVFAISVDFVYRYRTEPVFASRRYGVHVATITRLDKEVANPLHAVGGFIDHVISVLFNAEVHRGELSRDKLVALFVVYVCVAVHLVDGGKVNNCRFHGLNSLLEVNCCFV